MIAPNIDIPAGLEQAYYGIVRLLGGVNPDTIILKKGSPAKQNFSVFGARSLFVKWKDLYNGLSGARHLAWTTYWESLPFGSHGGLHGYPGSGFSAFIYVNAPRYQLGLDPLLDPPSVGAELLANPNFNVAAGNWELYNSILDSFSLYFNSSPAFGDSFGYPELTLIDGATYRVSFSVGVGSGVLTALVFNKEVGLDSFIADTVHYYSAGDGPVEWDFVFHSSGGTPPLYGWVLYFFGGYLDTSDFSASDVFSGRITNASFRQVI